MQGQEREPSGGTFYVMEEKKTPLPNSIFYLLPRETFLSKFKWCFQCNFL